MTAPWVMHTALSIWAAIAARLAGMRSWLMAIAAVILATLLHYAVFYLPIFIWPPDVTFSTGEIVEAFALPAIYYAASIMLMQLIQSVFFNSEKGARK